MCLSLSLSLSFLSFETGEVAIVRIAGEPLPLHAFIKFSTGRQFVNGAAGQKEPFPEPVIK